MARKTLLTLSISVTLASFSIAPTTASAQFLPGPPPIGPGGPLPIGAAVLLYSQDLLPWGLAARSMKGLAAHLLARAPEQFLTLQASEPAVAADQR